MKIIEPVVDEGKAKIPKLNDIIFDIMTGMSNKDLNDMNIIVTGDQLGSILIKLDISQMDHLAEWVLKLQELP